MFSPMMTIASAYTAGKTRQIKRDLLVIAFIGLMAVLVSMLLLAAFAAFVAETHGPVTGLLAAAALALVLGLLAIAVRALLRRRALQRQRLATSSAASALAVSTASNMIAQNKTMALAAGVAIGVIAGLLVRPGRD
ncbi:MAG: hypothetical protein ABJN75_10790 [Hoeflea sp.]|uniref:hypothetical protein n=1 Tax=Hoeflea sp. TaxID=1940281 RepID=UPI00329A2BA2|tara:strand:- start:21067 stop:21474 length:408 start_codon:yes stop_codon:yes gene_type:complete